MRRLKGIYSMYHASQFAKKYQAIQPEQLGFAASFYFIISHSTMPAVIQLQKLQLSYLRADDLDSIFMMLSSI